ncbi:MAG: CopG family transcriptional regulator [Spirochaetales bacterium]|nr:CopG family transcriptional regulator [Spirochaetales bacterium]
MARKEDIIAFKVDSDLAHALEGVPNRSEFIRLAVLAALDSRCPLCRGTGVLDEREKAHWVEFSRSHRIEECDDCHARRIVCGADADNAASVLSGTRHHGARPPSTRDRNPARS